VTYDEQLAQKAAEIEALFERYWTKPVTVTPSPQTWYYRNKIELNFGRKYYPEPPPKDFVKETVLGFKKKGKWFWTLDNDECLIASADLPDLLVSLRRWHRESGLRAYESRRHDGLLRHLIVREAKRTGERMVALITAPGQIDTVAFVDAVRRAYPATTILWGTNASPGDQAKADEMRTLFGSGYIHEDLLIDRSDRSDDSPGEQPREVASPAPSQTLRFRLSPFSFFQTNTLATEVLYGRIRDWCRSVAPRQLYDLYGGMGGIAFSCADLVESVSSVESWRQASLDGEYNAEINGIEHVRFVTATVEAYLLQVEPELSARAEGWAAVLDPPRAGLHPKALQRIVRLRPPDMLYVSCKPTVLAQELEQLVDAYEITGLEAFDLFPHTPHVEVVASLALR